MVERSDVDRDGGHRAVQNPVAGLESEAVCAADVGVGRVSQIGSRSGEHTLGRLSDDDIGDGVAVAIAGGEQNRFGYTLECGDGLIVGNGCDVALRDSQVDRGQRAVHRAVVHLEGKAVRAEVIGNREVSNVRRHAGESAVEWWTGDAICERVTIHITF